MQSVLDHLKTVSDFTGVLITGFLAGCFSILALVIAKENRLSELRQAWIDSLRSEIASLVAYATLIQAYVSMFPRKDSAESDQDQLKRFWTENQNSYLELNRASAQIIMRLNPLDSEPEAPRLLAVMKSLEGIFSQIRSSSAESVSVLTAEIENTAQPLLKKEWERVKRGELWHRRARMLALVLSGLFLATLIVGASAKLTNKSGAPQPAPAQTNTPCPCPAPPVLKN
jgi:hypothetical protein